MKKLLFLYNTHAGKGLLKSRLAAVQSAASASCTAASLLFSRPLPAWVL